MKLALTLLLAVVVGPAFATDMKALNRQVDEIVVKMKSGDPGAVEYRKARKIHLIDVDGDRVRDAVVFFTVEGFAGGNNYSSFMTVLKGRSSQFQPLDTIAVGGMGLGSASYSRPNFKDGRIVIERMEYVDADARCCPSMKANVTIVLQGSKLIEAQSQQ